jgi:hypothetical protein
VSSPPHRPRLPSVRDGPFGPPQQGPAADAPLRGTQPRKRPDDPPKPRLPVATPLPAVLSPAPAVLAALEAELFPVTPAAGAAPAAEPVLPVTARAALGVAYEAVLRELSEPEAPAQEAATQETAAQEAAAPPEAAPAPAVAVAPDIAAWFSARGLDLAGMTETLLRSYMREVDEQQRRRMG